jgi:hypothetical protein
MSTTDRTYDGRMTGTTAAGCVVTSAVWPPMRLATRGMRVVSRASAIFSAGRMVASRSASLDFPAPGGRGEGHYGHNARIVFTVASTCRER